ncbi:uncharacterized protein MONBRDRAFT_35244 [Monosiga brevicollis MX1]|uniref:RNA helicase n=1 Tax=Monosiga brevicollis TaxID=81824 RepID=A9V632_MONBE|nr:uncharacterized protein MONBRDRAFT_35244 [Monosiga brevicollis MX1]EDQ87002.1 predicted protein [Monosiga brevicollis MX1]|eukprot:XP_001748241.1 hypothetical protein [Monosiga brevicollis MX1]
MSFEDLKLSSWLIRQCRNLNFTRPTAVQQACVPAILNDEDVYAAAKTGSGKTAAFALPILEQLSHDPYGVYAVVLTPTRELAFQISDQFQSLGKPIGVRVATIVGGIDSIKQAVELSRRPHIIVATPGRLAVHTLVLDEADRLMTNETLQGHLDVILDALPEERQNLLFSATLLEEPSGKISQQLHRDLFRYSEIKEEATVTTLRQRYVFLPAHMRFPYLIHILRQLHDDKNNSIVLFVPTCRLCEELALTLRELDLRCTALHSQARMSQKARLDALHKFKSSFIHILLATDVASRGLDIPTVTYVINYNVPRAPEDYVHRVGRTARAGRGGMAITLMDERDIELLQAIEEHINVKLTAYDDIKDEEIVQSMNKINIARRAAELQLLESGFDERLQARKAKLKLMLANLCAQLASRKAAANDDESAGSEDQTMPPGKRTKGQKSSKSASQPATPKTGASKPQRRRNSKTPQKA